MSIWTTSGRIRGVRFACSEQARKLLAEHRKGESDLVHRDGMWFLIATTSTGYRAAGRGLNRHRKRQLDLRAKLQKKRTKSAKRLLKARARKEARHAANVNHIISKKIVIEAERTWKTWAVSGGGYG